MILERYVLREASSRDYSQRIEWNVQDSDATVILTVGLELTGGSKLTAECARKRGKPSLHLARETPGDPAAKLREFLTANAVKVLNVARSRASKEPEIAKFVGGVLTRAFEYHEVDA